MKDEPVVRPVCDICAESFSTKGALKTHIKGKKLILKCMIPKDNGQWHGLALLLCIM